MSHYQRISPQQALELLQQEVCAIADIRDPQSFAAGHLPYAFSLDNQSLPSFMAETPNDRPVLVVCYHGHSSQQAADFLAGQGYLRVYSLDGGFEHWKQLYPEHISRDA